MKIKKLFSFILCVCMIITVMPVVSFAAVNFNIPNVKALLALKNISDDFSEMTITLTADIVVNDGTFSLGENNKPLYNGSSVLPEVFASLENFNGTFDGQGHTISGLYLNSSLFKSCNGATIKNLNIVNSLVADETSEYTAAICSVAENTTFENCSINAYVIGKGTTAGLVAKADNCTLFGCRNQKTVIGDISGGLLGVAANSKIENCCNEATVIGDHSVGGLANSFDKCFVSYSYNSGDVKANVEYGHAGGLACYVNALSESDYGYTILRCYTAGEVSGYSAGKLCRSYGGDIFGIFRVYYEGKTPSEVESEDDLYKDADADDVYKIAEAYLVYKDYWDFEENIGGNTVIREDLGLVPVSDLKEDWLPEYLGESDFTGDGDGSNRGYPELKIYHKHIWGTYLYDGYNTETADCTVINCYETNTRECEETGTRVGSIIEYGSYPQSEVTDEALIGELDKIEKTWVSYGYYSGDGYLGSMVSSDYAKYADITYHGNKYRAVIFTLYRPDLTTYEHPEDYDNAGQNGYYINEVYYFKYEPLKWKVLDPDSGLVMCMSVIDSQAYNSIIYYNKYKEEYYNDRYSNKNYATDYETSTIRKWLNDDFYKTAFTDKEQSDIALSTIFTKDIEDTTYDSGETQDKVFLLSQEDVTNSEYGFITDRTRVFEASDYAKSQRLSIIDYPSTDEHLGYPDKICLRTTSGSRNVMYIASGGWMNPYPDFVFDVTYGIVPAMRINVKKANLNLWAQTNPDGSALKFITCVDSLRYKEIGFVITNADNPEQTITRSSKVVYTSIIANNKRLSAYDITGDENMKYILTFKITGLDGIQNTRFIVKPYVINLDDTTIYGTEKTFCSADMI